MNKTKIKKVCIFGSYKDLARPQKDEVVRLGQLLARRGFTVVSGGFGGTMQDISRGAKSAGGKTIGITYYKWETPIYRTPNVFIDEEIVAGSLLGRINIMLKKSDAFIILPGGTGTLLELSAVLEYLNKGLMVSKPVIALGNFWKPVLMRLRKEPVFSKKNRAVGRAAFCQQLVTFVSSPEACVKCLGDAGL